jgi:hypothetical protein
MKMINIRVLAIILLLVTSCKSNSPTRFYKSSDEVTGGFYDFSLELNSNGTLKLDIRVSTTTKQSFSGVEWQSNSSTITGKWFIDGKTIKYILDKPESSIDSIFLATDFNFKNGRNSLITFSPKFDTAYIYGVPCVTAVKISESIDSVRK